MARPRKSDASREQLLSIGMRLFSVQGYHATGLKQILDEGNVPKGSFYHYFGSKEAFAAEIIRLYMQKLFTLFAFEEDAPVLESLLGAHKKLIDLLNAGNCCQGCILGSITAEASGLDSEIRQAMADGFRDWQKIYEELFQRGQKTGEIRAGVEPDKLARLFLNHWEGGLLRAQAEGSSEMLEASLNTFCGVLLKP
ncbi:Transcriptional regulator AcuR [Pseudovibrio axinellae]|uniref:Transcriptional regulator AcuR n=1 Tax=Pseudovibrio axinellae TaxID=989403 RepID=A0A165Z1B7_9HYPH|nr:TetR/AcrR family transcriptional regulator [Pseudovibrio axinellae]KZL19425.1 Transcriptional regulator AcuR [Pseudovibrio axinellae]SER59500.1 transcriptional regulator, TetR family [Pseudovibrio axinellae]